MGYPNFGKVKTIVIPLPSKEMTLEEYKNHFGIDLKNFFKISASEMHFVSNDYVILDTLESSINFSDGLWGLRYQNVLGQTQETYEGGSVDGFVTLKGIDYGLKFMVSKNDPLALENIKVIGVEL